MININWTVVLCSFIIYLAGMDIEEKTVEKVANKNVPSLPWVEKYRPSHLNELISHQSILNTRTAYLT